MKKILITGGAGFIGLALAKKLVKKNFVDLIDNFSRGKKDEDFFRILKNKNVNFINHNLNNELHLEKQYDVIFHLAAIVGVENVSSDPFKVLTYNHKFLENIIKFSKNQKRLKKFFFFSTSEIYAGSIFSKLIKFPTPESQTITLPNLADKRSTYLLSKIYGESLCMHSGLPVVIVRPHNIYGPRMGFDHVIPQLAYKFLYENKVKIFNPSHKRTFCYIDDFIESLILLMKKKRLTHNIFNIGNPFEEIKIIDLAKKIMKYTKSNKKLYLVSLKNSSPIKRIPDIKRLKKETRFKNKINLDLGLIKTIEWYKKNFKLVLLKYNDKKFK